MPSSVGHQPAEMTTPAASTLAASLDSARVGVMGLGQTGLAVLEVLCSFGAQVTVMDSREEAVAAALSVSPGVRGIHGSDEEIASALADSDLRLMVVSPGVPATGAIHAAARARGIELWSEIELAWRLAADTMPGRPWLTLTGTDGKTTTIGMLASILREADLEAPAVGNIGLPAISVVREGRADALAVELSSFQLHTTQTLSPLAAACLNVGADHLDWHGSAEAYAADKARVYHQTQRGAIYNVADEATLRMVEEADVIDGCRAVGFTVGVPLLGQVGMVEDLLVDRAWHPARQREGQILASLNDLAHLVPGGQASRVPAHIVADALAAASLALAHEAVQADPEAIARGLGAYEAGAHRLQTVGVTGGVTWIDDSKATNTHAARAALDGMDAGRTVWIMGGDYKGASPAELIAAVKPQLRGVVVLGADQRATREALAAHAPEIPARFIGVSEREGGQPGTSEGGMSEPSASAPEALMREAVQAAAALAQEGDTVLLAPAAASWDQFRSYAQRGELFAAHVRALAEEPTA